mgnify:CR=1 FL=1
MLDKWKAGGNVIKHTHIHTSCDALTQEGSIYEIKRYV